MSRLEKLHSLVHRRDVIAFVSFDVLDLLETQHGTFHRRQLIAFVASEILSLLEK